VHRYAHLLLDTPEERKKLNDDWLGSTLGSVRRVDKRGIPVPSWWTDDSDTEQEQLGNALVMSNWRRR
jgi:hypothetical protein